jgi:Holliday junction resolvase
MAAQPAFNAALTRIGFDADAVAAINANQITTSESLIGVTKEDVEQLMKIVRGGNGQPVVAVPFMAQKKFTILCYWINRRSLLGESMPIYGTRGKR